jgi:hypothetical protein
LRVVVQTAGEAYRLKAADAKAPFSQDTALQRLALGYAQVRMVGQKAPPRKNAR